MNSTNRNRTSAIAILVVMALISIHIISSQQILAAEADAKTAKEKKADNKNILNALRAAQGDVEKIKEVVTQASETGPHTTGYLMTALEREFRKTEKKYGVAFKKLLTGKSLNMPADLVAGNEKLSSMRSNLDALSALHTQLREAQPDAFDPEPTKKKPKRSSRTKLRGPQIDVPRHSAATLFEELEIKEYMAIGIGAPGMSKLEIECVFWTNVIRSKHNLRILVTDPKLSDSARLHSKDQVDNNFRGHESPVEGRKTVRDRAKLLNTRADGENVAEAPKSGKQIVDYWMDSPGHRSNILHPQFRRIGVGEYQHVWTQVFGGIDSFAR